MPEIKGGVRRRSENVFREKVSGKKKYVRGKRDRSREDGVGGENWETRRGRSRAGLLRSPRDLHFVFATFGARPSLRNSDALLALLGTALATLGRIPPKEPWNGQALQVRYQGAPKAVWNYVEMVVQKLLGLKCKARGDRSKPARLLPKRVSQFSPPTPSSRERSIYGFFFPERISFYRPLFSGKRFSAVNRVRP